MKRSSRGVSVIEVLVTIGIITALVGIIMPAINAIRNSSNEAETNTEISQMDTALTAFFTDNGSYPKPGLEQMVASIKDSYFNFNPNRLDGNVYKDLWENPYLYISPGVVHPKSYDLYSVELLIRNGEFNTLSNILNALMASNASSSSGDSSDNGLGTLPIDVIIGDPAGVDKKTIWGLPKPAYDTFFKGALKLLRKSNTGYALAVKINIANIPIRWMTEEEDDLTTAIAWYDTEIHEIVIDPDYSYSSYVVATILAHEATHLSDHLANSDQYFDSLDEEYDAFYNSAMVWKEIKGSQTDTLMDYILSFIQAGEEVSKEILRQSYDNLPENEEYGDAYVVAKKY